MATREEHVIGGWRFDVAGAALIGAEGERRLEHRAARTLELLCRRRGETVTHTEILAEVWDSRTVSPNSVAVVIANLRRSLGDDARDPRHIATVAKRGYRLNRDAASKARTLPRSKRHFAMAAVLLAATAIAAIFLPGRSKQIVIVVAPVQNATGIAANDPLAKALSELLIHRVSAETASIAETQDGPSRIAKGEKPIRMTANLILWNSQPTLSLTATDPANGSVLWSGMAAGPADHLAATTIVAVHDFGMRTSANRSNRRFFSFS
jgi:DNA-binding winged helix-turn-helix (wHTH) protein